MPKTNKLRSRAALAVVAAFAVCALLPMASWAQSRGSLSRKLSATKQKATAVKSGLQAKRDRSVKAKKGLVEAQQELAAAESRLRRAERKLKSTREELTVVRKELEVAKKRLSRHEDAMQELLLTLFRHQEPSYVEVVLRATSFEDFADRAEFTRRLYRHDEDYLTQFVEDKQRVERQQALLEKKEAEEVALKAKVEKEKKVVASRASEAKKLRDRALTDLKEAEAQYAAMERERRSIEAMLARLSRGGGRYRYEGKWSGSLLKPVGGAITSSFGYRIHPILRTRRFHDGIDIAAPGGTPIRCAADGTVVSTGWKSAYGLAVIVDHGSGMSTMYAHCQRGSIRVQAGQRVSRGQTLSSVDSTGWSTGNHLHWTVMKNGRAVNPSSI